ncbi:MAG TPA: glycosyltransferase family 2 protein [Bacteroidales bacterium]|nr:glycosyltransferase family 2 protein [Bacteroidales bacterium]
MIWLAMVIFAFLIIRLLVVITNLITRPWLRSGKSADQPLVSVLVPARNEEKNLPLLLKSLSGQNYNNIEVIVYNDLSEDRTDQIVSEFSTHDGRVRLINGVDLPEGWLGKPHACHRLSEHARGEYLMFIDADVVIGPELINQSLSHTRKLRLDLLSIFPVQIMDSFGERISVPLMKWILLSLLPLILTRVSGWKAFSAANGQFMLFKTEAYRKFSFHKLAKNEIVEDIKIFKLAKKMGLSCQTLIGTHQIKCRMYGSFSQAITGFSKNVFEFFGGSILLTAVMVLLTTLGFLPVYLALGFFYVMVWLTGEMLVRALVAVAARQNVGLTILLWPAQQIAFVVVFLNAIKAKTRGYWEWKGRRVN